ncbi:uncharacterized protein LOC108857606 [Raphanus sativus]|uniref:Uncharacterized protein LOC108857606 n=1 Tax=Raphanus sativus TaxID=3726 RepID=A0A6J0NRL5_RAPSA|nr:uncharacterized protein LOC108857606 [Raphanus sativus]
MMSHTFHEFTSFSTSFQWTLQEDRVGHLVSMRTMQTAVGVFGGDGFTDMSDVLPLMVANAGNSNRAAISSSETGRRFMSVSSKTCHCLTMPTSSAGPCAIDDTYLLSVKLFRFMSVKLFRFLLVVLFSS